MNRSSRQRAVRRSGVAHEVGLSAAIFALVASGAWTFGAFTAT